MGELAGIRFSEADSRATLGSRPTESRETHAAEDTQGDVGTPSSFTSS